MTYSSNWSGSWLRYAERNSSGGWSLTTIESRDADGNTSVAFDQNNRPVIAWSDDLNADNSLETLRLSRYNGSSWQTGTVETGVAGYGVQVDVSINSNNEPAIVHDTGNVRYVEKTASGWTVTELELELELTAASDGATLTHAGDDSPHIALRRADGLTHITRDASGWVYSRIKTGSSSSGQPKVQLDQVTGAPLVLYKTPGAYVLELAEKNPRRICP